MFMCDCIFQDSVMFHEESERIVSQRERGMRADSNPDALSLFRLFASFSIHSAHIFNIRGQIN